MNVKFVGKLVSGITNLHCLDDSFNFSFFFFFQLFDLCGTRKLERPHGGHGANFILAPSWFVDLHISGFIAFQELNISL